MKIALIAAVSLSLFAVSAQAQAPARHGRRATADGTFVAPRNPAADNAAIAPSQTTDGVIPRAARSGNPLQMVNPLAPAEYGSGEEVVRHDDNDPYQKARGIKLFAFAF